jgi:hypothetical protein
MNQQPRRTLQVRMTAEQLDQLRSRAESLGFNSVPAYVRYWATADARQVDNRSLTLNEPSRLALRYLELLLAQAPNPFVNADAALDHIIWKLKRQAFKRDFRHYWSS